MLPFLCFQFVLTPLIFQLQSVLNLNSPLIETNRAMPESEQSRIRDLLHDIERELETIDTQIRCAFSYSRSDKQATSRI